MADDDQALKHVDEGAREIVHASRIAPQVVGGAFAALADATVPGSGLVVGPAVAWLCDRYQARWQRWFLAFAEPIDRAAAESGRPLEDLRETDAGAFFEAYEQLRRIRDDRAAVTLGRLVAHTLFGGWERDAFFRDAGQLIADASPAEWDELVPLAAFLGGPAHDAWRRFMTAGTDTMLVRIRVRWVTGPSSTTVDLEATDGPTSISLDSPWQAAAVANPPPRAAMALLAARGLVTGPRSEATTEITVDAWTAKKLHALLCGEQAAP